jgi:hypothetical protein
LAQAGFSTLIATVGQPTPPGQASGGRFALFSGFLYTLDAGAPSVQHTPISSARAGEELVIEAGVTDDSGVAEVVLNYRPGGGAGFTSAAMGESEGTYRGVIPKEVITSRGVEYFVRATDQDGNVTRFPVAGVFSIRVRVAEPGVVRGRAQPSGSEQTAYRLISLPIEVDNMSPADVLEDDLGNYDNTKWRFFSLRPNQTYAEYPNTPPMAPGSAFWLIVGESGKIIDTGAGRSNPTERPYAIPLNPGGWTFVGNPFNFPVPVANLSLKSGGPVDIRTYTGVWGDLSTSLAPFEGYAVANSLNEPDTLFVNPELTPAPAKVETGVTRSEEDVVWQIRILARSGDARDEDNVAMVSPKARTGWDQLDRPEPPVIGKYVSVYFPHPEWNKPFAYFCTDARPEIRELEVWDFEVESNIRSNVNLTFEGITEVPDEFEIRLVDETMRRSVNLRRSARYGYFNPGAGHPRRLKLVLGREDSVAEAVAELTAIPSSIVLYPNYPNPFNPSTRIRYSLPRVDRVTLKVFNLLGEAVATLVPGKEQAAGFHTVVWDGKNEEGNPVASGVYVYVLQAGKVRLVKKMVLAK